MIFFLRCMSALGTCECCRVPYVARPSRENCIMSICTYEVHSVLYAVCAIPQ